MTLEQQHALAWGEIGLTPYQYYCLTPYEFQCIIKGWRKKNARNAALVRQATALICNVWIEKKVDFQQIWPIEEVDGTEADKRKRGIALKRELKKQFALARQQAAEMNRAARNN